ncbi:VOC family protein [Marinomonas aquiplantarum]|uniref:Catechol 2,3-dioxygenase-like lactoylglutathione lyase family enzyme n=1 Tax=Marinomonas aquiplantarum TaxID=491951 RepID=A0A366CST2_9GAMM|nr:catechol 2,3-dioxygenase-like lactoylglutathione lyase family enzyme [Marinomonas aquiplantarum]
MMRLEHLNLVVKDIDETLSFYKAVFPHWRVRSNGRSNWYGVERNWLHFGDDYQFIAFNNNGSGENRELTSNQVGLAHFAFVTNNIESVIKCLAQAGFEIAKQGADNPHRKNVYFIDPSGYEVEFVQYLSDLPEERNNDD